MVVVFIVSVALILTVRLVVFIAPAALVVFVRLKLRLVEEERSLLFNQFF